MLADLAVGATEVDGRQVLGQAGVVEEHIRPQDLLRKDACNAQHRPAPVLQLCLSVPATQRHTVAEIVILRDVFLTSPSR